VLLALATMIDGMDIGDVEAACGSELNSILPDWEPDKLPISMRGFFGFLPRERIPALEPDILGEVFVLEFLKDKSDATIARL